MLHWNSFIFSVCAFIIDFCLWSPWGSYTIAFIESESEVAQSCLTLCDPMDCSLPSSSVDGIFQAIVLEWIAISFSRGSSRPRDRTQVSCIVDRRFTVWAISKNKSTLWGQHSPWRHWGSETRWPAVIKFEIKASVSKLYLFTPHYCFA